MGSLKDILANRPDLKEQTVVLDSLGGETVTIRRLKVAERNQLAGRFGIGSKEPKAAEESGCTYGIAMIAISMVPAMTEAEVMELPSAVADELGDKMMQFNGWTKKGAAELADQFRTPA